MVEEEEDSESESEDIIENFKQISLELKKCLDKEKDCGKCPSFTECMQYQRAILSTLIDFFIGFIGTNKNIVEQAIEKFKEKTGIFDGKNYEYYT